MRTHARTLFVISAAVIISLLLLQGSSAKLKREQPGSAGRQTHSARSRASVFTLQDDGPLADLTVTKSSNSDTVPPDSNLTYTIEVTNIGPDNAANATVTDNLPAGTTFASLNAPQDWNCTTPNVGGPGTVTCVNASLAVNSEQTFTLVVHVGGQNAQGSFVNNTATVSTETVDPNDENNSSTASTFVGSAGADMGVTQTVNSDAVVAGRDVVYQIHVTNGGPSAAANASLSDTLPGTLTFVSLSAPAGANCMTPAVGSGGTVTCSNASFPAGGSADFILTVNVPANTPDGTEFENTATVSTDTNDPNDENNSAVTSVTVSSCLSGTAVVTNADSGAGSLRQAIADVCPGATITFDMTQTISPIALTSGELLIDKDVTIQGPGANVLTVKRDAAASDFRVFEVNNGKGNPTVNISGLTVSGGKTTGSAPTGNGGAVLQVNGTLNISDSLISGNSAAADGGGIFGSGTLNITRTTVSGNTAARHGGGIEAQGNTSVVNSTVVNNTAQQEGGGIGTSDAAANIDVNVESSTVSGNTAANGGGFYLKGLPNKYNFKNTILSGNKVGVSVNDAENSGTLTSQGYNVVGTLLNNTGASFTTQPTDQLNTAPGLALDGSNKPLLANNGGTTPTVLPLINSPVIDKGNSFGLETDQRGLMRPVDLDDSAYPDAAGGDAADAGAVEVNYSLVASAGTPQSTFINTNFATQLQVTLTESGRPVSGVTVNFSAPANGASATFPSGSSAVTDAQGRASVTVKANAFAGSYSVTAMAGPLAASFSLTNLSGGTIQLSSAAYEVNENGSTAVITVTRTNGSTGAASVNFSTSAGTATGGASCSSGVDFVNTSVTLSWADGDASDKTVAVPICDDPLNEPDETVNLALSNITGIAAFGSQTTATLTIHDNDPPGGIIAFSAALYTVAERAGQRTINVVRTGDTTRAANVDYTTDDGSIPSVAVPCSTTTGAALQRCDYTHTAGTLRFAAGETLKTFNVPINDDSYVEGPETARLVLSNPTGGAVLGAQSSSTLQIDDDATESTGNPIDDDRNFVRQQYHDFLNREPDTTGWDFWTNNITSCGANAQCREVKRIDTSAAFFLSIEFQQTGYFVYLTRKAAYGNLSGTPIPVRLLPFLRDTQEIGRGVIVGQGAWQQQLEANKQAFLLAFVGSDEFRARYPAQTSATAFVNSLDSNAGGVLNSNEKTALISELSANPTDAALRADVLRNVAENSTFVQREFNRAFVLMQYFGYLRRDPDAAPDSNFDGYNFWLTKLDSFGGDYKRAEMVKAFINSSEYRQRFGKP